MVLCIESCGNPGIQWLEWKAPSVFMVGLRARLGFALAYIGSRYSRYGLQGARKGSECRGISSYGNEKGLPI